MEGTQLGLKVAFYLYPCLLFVALLGTQLVQYFYHRHKPQAALDNELEQRTHKLQRTCRNVIWVFQLLVSILILASIIIVARAAINQHHDPNSLSFPFSAFEASYAGVFLFFAAGLLPDPEGPWTPELAHCSAWVVGSLAEIAIVSFLSQVGAPVRTFSDSWKALAALGLSRTIMLLLMTSTQCFLYLRLKRHASQSVAGESQSLLPGEETAIPTGYGATNGHSKKSSAGEPERKTQVSGTGWLEYIAGFRTFSPYLWPKDSYLYQVIVVICMCILVLQRIVNVLAPLQLGVLVDSLGKGKLPWKEVILYVVYRALQGNQGILGATRAVMWIPVSQSLYRRLSAAAFEQVLGLSLDFHLNKKIGEVTSALSRGSAINGFLETFCFNVFPMIFDIFVAGIIFFTKYDPFYTLIVFFIMWSYIFLTIYVAKYRGKQRRDMTVKGREMEAVKTEAIIAFETVQHNCAVPRETQRYRDYIFTYQRAERLVQWSLNILNLTQSSIFTLGTALLVGVSAYRISIGEQTAGEFVSLINYFVQLQGPLNFFGTYYTMLQSNLIEAERLLELFNENTDVVEKPGAISLPSRAKEIAFDNVSFAYQSAKGNEPVIDGFSFTVPSGTKTAIVGESGAGKSTCLKLLYRFYDVTEGSILVDGHDIRDLKMSSLRQNIGVVPQDAVLFNATIMYNLLYANPAASEDDVHRACRAANIHDRILNFPDGYESKVGERGLKLSGGERQRVAIARAILKDANILLLDEATASLDSHTEREIQDALEQVTAGRTTITIAHRLSTITNSDQILVAHKGKIIERGTHKELLALGSRYYEMWEKQTQTEKEEADQLK